VLRFDAIVGNLVTSGIEINGTPLGLIFVKVRYRTVPVSGRLFFHDLVLL
jgi:hypothetical protein